ncbi:MAG: peptide chain release factor 2 [Candidatus Portnoybacteria bacterium]|nr:peptide chain release factor 2 [Candidatus Portnoybacteria bacterium]
MIKVMEISEKIEELKNKILQMKDCLDLEKKKERLIQLEELAKEENFWDNPKKAAEINEEISELSDQIDFWENIEEEIEEMRKMYEIGKDDESLQEEIEDRLKGIEHKFEKEEFKALFSGKYDRRNAIIGIYSGAGGTEAQDWANMILRMYTRYAEESGFKVKILDITHGQEAGIKSAVVEIKGSYAYGYLKGENGVHRLVRLSPFNADNLRHTSFVLVEVLPEISKDIEKDLEIKEEDLKIDTFRSSGPGGQNVNMRSTAVRITHLPTGIVAACQAERSQGRNKERAMQLLYTKLYQKKLKEKEKEKENIRGDLPSAEWGSQIRSYVLHPYKMVKDHRTGIESNNPEEVLDGGLGKFIEEEIRYIKNKKHD